MVCVTHEMGFAREVSDRVIFMGPRRDPRRGTHGTVLHQPAARAHQGVSSAKFSKDTAWPHTDSHPSRHRGRRGAVTITAAGLLVRKHFLRAGRRQPPHRRNPFPRALRQRHRAGEPPQRAAGMAAGLDVEQTSIPRQDWTVAWREFFTPVRAGQFIVLPPWLFETTPLEGRKPIIIEPKSAFGTGHHNTDGAVASKRLPNSWPRAPSRPGSVFFDVGTGSGILGIACCLNGLAGLGSDIDPVCRGQRPRERGHQQGGRRFSASSPAVPRRAKASGSRFWWSPTSLPARSVNWPRRSWPG